MSEKFNRPEVDPEHIPVSQETKDEFLMLVDELTERGYVDPYLNQAPRMESIKLKDGRMLNLSFYPNNDPSKVELKAQALVSALRHEGETTESDNILYRLLKNNTFEKLKYQEKEMFKMSDFGIYNNSAEKKRIQVEEVKTLSAKVKSRTMENEELRKLGIITATEAEAREIIDILKEINEQQER